MTKLSKRELSEKKHFNIVAEKYDANYHYKSAFTKYKILKKVDDFIFFVKKINKKQRRILEVGCGTGEYTAQIAKVLDRDEIVALDISPNILRLAKDKCKKYKNVTFVSKSAYNTGFKDNSFDVIFGFYILHHLDVDRLRKEAFRILKPGGILFFYEPNILNPVVFLIKSNKVLKEKAGDSPQEWAINPLKIKKQMTGFKPINISTTEFIWPVSFMPTDLLVKIDLLSNIFRKIPLINIFGGSVQVVMKKND